MLLLLLLVRADVLQGRYFEVGGYPLRSCASSSTTTTTTTTIITTTTSTATIIVFLLKADVRQGKADSCGAFFIPRSVSHSRVAAF